MPDDTDISPPKLTPHEEETLAELYAAHSAVRAAYVFGSAATGRRTRAVTWTWPCGFVRPQTLPQ